MMQLSRRQFNAGLLTGTAGLMLPGCVTTNKATGRDSFTGFYSPEDDIKIGRENHPKMLKSFGGAYEDPRLESYVTRIGNTLARQTEYRQFPYRFTLLNTPIVNAFALPGGYVYISRGLLALASNEAEMAGVLAHELGHVNARHSAERMSATQMAQLGLFLGAIGAQIAGVPAADTLMQVGQTIAAVAISSYSQQQEFEADMLGVRYMSRAGYDPDGMVTFLRSLRAQSRVEARMLGLPEGQVDQYNMMSTHPRTIDRVKKAQAAAKTKRPKQARWGRQEYLNAIDGIMFGDDPSQGLVVGQRFVHPELGFEFSVPSGYVLRNSPTRVSARDDRGNAIVFNMAKVSGRGRMTDYLQYGWAKRTRLNGVEALTVNGMEAATGWVEGNSDRGRVQLRAIAIRRDARSVYRFIYLTRLSDLQRLDRPLRRSTYSLKRLSAREAAGVKAMRLLVVPAQGDENIDSLAKNLPYGRHNAAWFRVLNDLPAGRQPKSGQPLKVIAS
jgi:predicted Zn-dependent protease